MYKSIGVLSTDYAGVLICILAAIFSRLKNNGEVFY